jgi:hypothetical protein
MEGSQPDVILFLILLRQASGRFTCIWTHSFSYRIPKAWFVSFHKAM